MNLLKSLGPHNCHSELDSNTTEMSLNVLSNGNNNHFLHPGNSFQTEGTLSFLKDEVPLRDSFNHTLLPKCCCTPTTTHPSPKERGYCTRYWCCLH